MPAADHHDQQSDAYEAYIQRVVDSIPPLTTTQRESIGHLLRDTSSDQRRAA